ncbi:nuclear transport factor 2 family protein [uncultured Aeromicrobium sp.]|uniref:nuclear transport factor 2 family protein n=1 Tax=uncultured Aeromicrobium sp. TaxID=337820 RepID=UPI0025F261E7|nr:nuclear transport factor 2 family protein [uncultured Aeromicrobium sp.]
MTREVLAAHRAFYDAIETGDLDLMASLWVDAPGVTCVHPAAAPLRGTEAVLRSWAVLMAQVEYIQFFLTDIEVTMLPVGAEQSSSALIVCTENILSDGVTSESFTGGSAICSSLLIRDGRHWRFWSRHASPVAIPDPREEGS